VNDTFLLALCNLLRNRRRSAATLLAMIVGTHAVLLFGGYSRNIAYGLQTDYVKYGGHLQIQREGYFRYGSGNPAAYSLVRYREIIAALKADPVLAPMLVVATPVLQLQGIAGNSAAGVSRAALALGVEVEDQNRMRAWNDYGFPVEIPPLPLTGTRPDAAIVGTGMARVLQLCAPLGLQSCDLPPAERTEGGAALPGDVAALAEGERKPMSGSVVGTPIELLAATARGAPNVARLDVVKAEEQAVKEFDDVYVGLHLRQAQRLVFGNDQPRATAVVVQLKHTHQLHEAQARIEEILAVRADPNLSHPADPNLSQGLSQ
jgi:putative ABC transport system permease protein